jgi:hypothetical protein
LHVVAVTTSGGLRHAIRTADGSWTSFGDVEAIAGQIGGVTDAEAVVAGTKLHVVAIVNGTLFHTIRHADGTWDSFHNADMVIGNQPGPHTSVGLGADFSGNVHLCTTTPDGNLWHTIRSSNGTWAPFGNVKAATGSNPGVFSRVDCSIVVPRGQQPTLHVTALTVDGVVWHAIRFADGSWTQFGNLSLVAGGAARFTDVDCTGATNLDQLQVIGTASSLTMGSAQQHTLRHPDGTWQQPFGNVLAVAGNPGAPLNSSSADVDGNLHVALTVSGGGLFHTIRNSAGGWTQYDDVRAATGSAEAFRSVSLGGQQTQVCIDPCP